MTLSGVSAQNKEAEVYAEYKKQVQENEKMQENIKMQEINERRKQCAAGAERRRYESRGEATSEPFYEVKKCDPEAHSQLICDVNTCIPSMTRRLDKVACALHVFPQLGACEVLMRRHLENFRKYIGKYYFDNVRLELCFDALEMWRMCGALLPASGPDYRRIGWHMYDVLYELILYLPFMGINEASAREVLASDQIKGNQPVVMNIWPNLEGVLLISSEGRTLPWLPFTHSHHITRIANEQLAAARGMKESSNKVRFLLYARRIYLQLPIILLDDSRRKIRQIEGNKLRGVREGTELNVIIADREVLDPLFTMEGAKEKLQALVERFNKTGVDWYFTHAEHRGVLEREENCIEVALLGESVAGRELMGELEKMSRDCAHDAGDHSPKLSGAGADSELFRPIWRWIAAVCPRRNV